MDLEDDKTVIMAEEEDRLSNLPDDIIHRILSLLDMKHAVQTSTLSHKWKLIWTSIPHLNLNSYSFRNLPSFAKFVKHVLSQRNNISEVSGVDLTFTGAISQFFVKSIINYAYSHNIRELAITFANKRRVQFPPSFFSSHTLKHLTLVSDLQFILNRPCSFIDSPWDFPALKTLYLSNMKVTDGSKLHIDLFSKCVNLTSLTLHRFCLLTVEVFNIYAPKLSNLTITDAFVFPKAFNVVASNLETLTASVSCRNNAVTSSYLKNADKAYSTLQFSTGFDSLDRVELSLSSGKKKEEDVPVILDLFQKLRSAKFLVVNADIIETLSSSLDRISHEPCPLNSLNCLKIENQNDSVATKPTQVLKYLLENSPCATVIMESPQPAKRSREQAYEDTLAKKLARLDSEALAKEKAMLQEKLEMQDKLIGKQRAVLELLLLQYDRVTLDLVKSKMEKLQVQVEGGNPDYDVIRSIMFDIKTVKGLIPEKFKAAMEATFASQYEEMKSLVLTRVDADQWAKIEAELEIVRPLSHNQAAP